MKKVTRPDYDLKAIGKNLRKLRKKKGLSVDDVSEYLGIASDRTIYYYESGERVAPFDVMFALMELYEADLADVIGAEKAKIFYPWGESDDAVEKWLRMVCESTNPPINYEDCLNEEGKFAGPK
ncbi:helix-turn-helix domain-containing protein [Pseudobutyrivibrio sp.]|uniref:helix-turn-helix domain-containing protein n=1 Tax=Pseudobutyrivibrio sp. TaxID=2014367 RepID=UPI003865225F